MYDTGWIKSSRSSGASDNCVEVRLTDTAVGVRDSKNPDGPVHTFTHHAWRAFLHTTTEPAEDRRW
ncbi:protein of unknown function [Actinopolyspora mzabensis]|uniref:DUF397 domain-containing protein n=1 Tax=Actinopolyspora mzabensis TaxID=995066 RepID=A0A1G8VTS6_ACTMZ|nr:DUF397 domain-containing protein [Actinopolyspora mzabensis]SDJ68610.1 protein of unknown function [Actinopolyspora mzabensis]